MSIMTGGFGQQVAAYTYLTSKKDINITMPEGEYPLNVAISGTWENKAYTTDTKYIDLSLTDSDGNIACDLGRISLSGRQRRTGEILYENVSGLTLTGKKLYIKASGSGLNDIGLYGYASVVIETAKKIYNITLSAGTGGSLTANKATATKGEQVTLTPTPATGYRFKSYSISPNTISITADKFTMPAADVTVTATFEKIIYTITVNSGSGSPGGTVTTNKVLATMGEEVTLTVSPGTGVQLSSFTKVPGNLSISNNKFTMPAANVTITANWSWIQRTVTVNAGTGGSLTTDKATAHYGETVTLTPTPSTGYKFKNYTTVPANLTITNNKFTMPNSNVTVTANFEKIEYTITINSSGSTDPTGTVTANKVKATIGETIVLTPSPNTGVQLSGYTKSPSSLVITNNQFTMPAANVTITPTWSWISRTVTANAGTGGTLTTNKATAHYGEQVKLTPTAETGYRFKNYTTVPANLEITDNKFTMPNSNVTVTANFEKIKYSITVNSGSGSPGGTVTANKTTATMGETVVLTVSPNTGVQLKSFTKVPSNLSISSYQFTMPAANVTITAVWEWIQRTITLSAGTGGRLTASKLTAHYGEQITLTPSPNTGYQFSSYTKTPGTLAISANKFTMPNSNVTIAASFSKINYTITKVSNPTGAGTITTGANTAHYGDQVTVSQTPAAGYYFNGWTITPGSVAVSSGKITMPAANVTIKANYLKRSTASLSKTTMSGGDTVTLTITPDKSTYSHKYKLSFGTGMETSLTTVAAGTTSVSISIPEGWSDAIPNAKQKTGGTLTLETYNGSTKIGEYTISSLKYTVPASVMPTIGTITTSVARTINGTTYANVGDIYVQNKCGVRIQTTASGARSSTIASIKVELAGYYGTDYTKTVTAASIDFTTKLLKYSGSCVITVTATDSRGRTVKKTKTITVTAYSKPTGTLTVKRADENGNDDRMGTYGKYTKTNSYTQVGNNTLTVTLRSQNTNASNPANSGNLLPTSRQTFSITSEYAITLTLQDAFETVVITAKLPTAQFMMYFGPNGDRMAFMKAVNSSLSKNNKSGVIEFSDDAQVYIGSSKLETYIINQINRRTMQQYVMKLLDENGNSSVAVLVEYPTKPGVYRVGTPISGIPTGTNGYGPLIIYDGGSYVGHIYIDANMNFYYAKTTNVIVPSKWYKLTGTEVDARA